MPQKPWEEMLQPLNPCSCKRGNSKLRINSKVYGHGDFGPEIECPDCGKTLSIYYWDNGVIENVWNKMNS